MTHKHTHLCTEQHANPSVLRNPICALCTVSAGLARSLTNAGKPKVHTLGTPIIGGLALQMRLGNACVFLLGRYAREFDRPPDSDFLLDHCELRAKILELKFFEIALPNIKMKH